MNRGSTLVEALGGILLGFVALALLFQIARSSWTFLWMDQVLYETLICAAEHTPPTACTSQARIRARQIPLAPSDVRLRLRRHGHSWKGEIRWKAPLQIKGRLRQQLRLAEKDLS